MRTIRTDVAAATATGHLTELLYDDGSNDDFLVCAPHGGEIEPPTAEQAIDLAMRLPNATCWALLGYDTDESEFERWHEPSTAIEPEEYELLEMISEREFDMVIGFHGLGSEGFLVGGRIDERKKRQIADRFGAEMDSEVRAISEGPYAGVNPENVINRLSGDAGGSLQLEQGSRVRNNETEVVNDVLEDLVRSGTL